MNVNQKLGSLLLGLFVWLAGCGLMAGLPAYPLKVAPGGRYLMDQNNHPFLIIGASPHNLFTSYTTEEACQYLTNRANAGINTLWVECLTGPYTSGPPNGSNLNGDIPFTNTLGSYFDLSTAGGAYWTQCSNVVYMAATNGIQILLDSFETGQYDFMTPAATANGANRCRQYGQFLGLYFKNFTNILWITGNDYQNWQTATNDACVQAIALGIADTDTNHLQTVQLDYPISMSYDDSNWRSLISINGVYTYYTTYYECLKAYTTNTMPGLLLEANYEGENNPGGDGGTPSNLRRQEYWSLLGGSTAGHVYGNKYEWAPLAGWENNLNTVGVTQLGYFRNFFTNLAWYALVPDQTHKLISSGYGTFDNANDLVETSDYATAALTTNRTLGVVYTPVSHTLTVRMTNFNGIVTARWFDPSANTFTAITGSPFANTITTNLTTPGNNAVGDGDWVLLLQASACVAPQIKTWTFNGGNFVVGFCTVTGRIYELQRTDALSPGSWLPVATNIPGTGGIVQVTDTNAQSHAQRFYRVKTGQ